MTETVDLVLPADLTILEAAATRARLLAALEATTPHPAALTLDLSAVEELDTAGLQLLLALVADAGAVGVGVAVRAVSPAVAEVLAVVGLDGDLRPERVPA